MNYFKAIAEVKAAKELDAQGEDGQLWLQKKYCQYEMIEMYDHHNGDKESQRYISQAMSLQQKLAKAGA